MDPDLFETLKVLSEKTLNLWEKFWSFADDRDSLLFFRFSRVLHLLTPMITVVIVYHFLKFLLIHNACKYEEFVKRKYERIKKVNKNLKLLAKRYGNLYFCYLPMNHGTALPRTYNLFLAIKDVLTNSERPASRVLQMNLLSDLLHANQSDPAEDDRLVEFTEPGYFDDFPNDVDPLSEFNLDIMKCSRELIIQGVKDFDTMSTVYRVLETVVEDAY